MSKVFFKQHQRHDKLLEVVEKWWTTFGGSKNKMAIYLQNPNFLVKKREWWEKQTRHLWFFIKKILVPTMRKITTKKSKHFTIILNCLLIWKVSILHILCTKTNFKREGPSTYKIRGLHIVRHGQEINKMYNNGLEQVYTII